MGVRRIGAVLLALTVPLLAAALPASPPAQAPVRIYELYSQQEFNGGGCYAEWSVSQEAGGFIFCQGDAVVLGVNGDATTTPIIWRNDLFPSTGNIAIEARFRYPVATHPYGNDALTAYDRQYSGQRLLNDGQDRLCSFPENQNLLWLDYCPGVTSGEVLGSHALGRGTAVRVDTSYDNIPYYTHPVTTDWFNVVWEYREATGVWRMWVGRNVPPSSNISEPGLEGLTLVGQAVIEQGRPVAMKIGHHVRRTEAGKWNQVMVDYIRVWRWREVTMHLTARYPRLVYRAPALGLPAQTLIVEVSGMEPPYRVDIHVVPPSQAYTPRAYTATQNPWTYGPAEAGDAYFGVTEMGLWRAWVTVNGVGTSNPVSWEVRWYPVHVIR